MTIEAPTPAATTVQPPLSRTIRTGLSLSVGGTISVQVDVYAAVGEEKLSLSGICVQDHAPAQVKQSLACPICGNSDRSTHLRGKAKDDGFVIVPQEVIDLAGGVAAEFHDEMNFSVHRAADVAEAMPSGKTYYLKPPAGAQVNSRYATLAAVVESRSDLCLVAVGSLKGALSRFVLIASHGTLMLRQLADPTLVRQRPVVQGEVEDKGVATVSAILDMVVTSFDPLERTNFSQQVIQKYIDEATAVAGAPLPEVVDAPKSELGSSLDEWVASLQELKGKALVAVPEVPADVVVKPKRARKSAAKAQPAAEPAVESAPVKAPAKARARKVS